MMALVLSAGALPAAEPDIVQRGRTIFHATWMPPGAATEFTGLGPLFNVDSCASCHVDNGRGAPPRADDRSNTSLVVKFATDEANKGAQTVQRYGNRLNFRAVAGLRAEGELTVTFEAVEGRYADGERYTLQKPVYGFDKLGNGPVDKDTIVAVRMAPAIAGLGLLAQVPDDWIKARADMNAKGEGPVKGRPNVVWDPINFRMTLGRFGWKADQPNLTRIIAAAFITDMGLTSRLFPQENCGERQPACRAAAAPHPVEVDDATLDAVTHYVASLKPPVPLTLTNTPLRSLPYLRLRVCKLAAPSWCSCCTSATTRSPSAKKLRICSSSVSVRLRRMPPGRLMAEICRMASCEAATSTRHRLACTSTMRPTTRSPISGV